MQIVLAERTNPNAPWEENWPEARKLAPGIPKATLWADDPYGINQIGCIYNAMGFEFDYVGVIMGLDLRYNFDTQSWEGHPGNSHDQVVKRSKDRFTDLTKNTYRALVCPKLRFTLHGSSDDHLPQVSQTNAVWPGTFLQVEQVEGGYRLAIFAIRINSPL